jgi:hypothetical protein
VQRERFDVLEQDAAVTVHDRLGQAGRARGVEHIQRMVERHRLVRHRRRLADQLGPRQGAGRHRRLLVEVGQHDGVLQARERGPDRGDLVAAVDRLVPVAVAVDRDQHARFDLAPAVGHAAKAELRRAGGEHRPQAGGGEHQHNGLGNVGQVGRYPIAPAHTESCQPGSAPGHLRTELGGGEVDRCPRLRPAENDDGVVVAAGQP